MATGMADRLSSMGSSIRDAIGGNPFATSVGQKIEQATDISLPSEDWALNMEICDLVNSQEEGPRDALRAIRKRLHSAGKNWSQVMYSLTVLEACVKNCGPRFQSLACQRESIQDLIKVIGTKNDPPQAVQDKILGLIQNWAEAFRNEPANQGVVSVYNEMKAKGIPFPATDLDTMAPIQTPPRSVPPSMPQPKPATQTEVRKETGPAPSATQRSPRRMPEAAVPISPITLTEVQVGKIKSELDIVQGNCRVFSEMLTELKPGEEKPEDLALLKELYATCRSMQQRVVGLVSQVTNDEVTADLLTVNDELNTLFLRYGKYDRRRKGMKERKEEGNAAAQPVGEAAAPLIDLGDMTDSMGQMSLKPASASAKSEPMRSEPMAGGADGGDFDMFAMSRTGRTTGSTYEDNLNPDQHAISLGVASQLREDQKNGTDVSLTSTAALNPELQKDSDFAEMEAWLAEKPISPSSSEPKPLSSTEFDKFLAERAAVASSSKPKKKEDDDPFGL